VGQFPICDGAACRLMISTWTTHHFEEWDYHLSQTIGHHRSTLLTPAVPFFSRMTVWQAEGVSAVALEGTSCLHLHRWQPPDQLLLWLPQLGWVDDRINGQPVLAEPGSAMLCLPGDELVGDTTASLQGVSILLPIEALGSPCLWEGVTSRHLAQGPEVVALVESAQRLVAALAAEAPDTGWQAMVLAEHLLFWRDLSEQPPSERSLGGVERRRQIHRAQEWIEAHLHEPLRVSDLAEALHLSTRSLQYCFRQEVGHSPLEAIRLLRLRRLRRLLRTAAAEQQGIEALYRQCGLNASAATRRQYRQWCGETPDQSRSLASFGQGASSGVGRAEASGEERGTAPTQAGSRGR